MTAPHAVIAALREEIATICRSFGQADGKVRDSDALKSISTLSAAISLAQRCKVPVDPFDVLVDTMNAAYAKDYAPPSDLESAYESISATRAMIRLNLDTNDPLESLIQNLAQLTCEVRRMADIVVPMVPPHLMDQIIAENQP